MRTIIGADGRPAPSLEPKIDLTKSTAVTCQSCGDQVFSSATIFRKISKIITGTPKDAMIPIEVFVCMSCGTLVEELLPPELKELK